MIKRLVRSEKHLLLCEKYNQYTFDVTHDLSKVQIRLLIEKIYLVRVNSVNTLRIPFTNRRSSGAKAKIKRAIVTLAHGEEISIFYYHFD